MALGVEGMGTGRVLLRATFLTLGTLVFVAGLMLTSTSMRAVTSIGGSCASGGPYVNAHPCPTGVAGSMLIGIFAMTLGPALGLAASFPQGGPRLYVFEWTATFLALGWNFLDYGLNPTTGDTSWAWLFCGIAFVVMGVVPLFFLLAPKTFKWATWGPTEHSVAGSNRLPGHRSPRDLVRLARQLDPENRT
jgi:hypothetical protein